MNDKRFLVALGALTAALAACSSEIDDPATGMAGPMPTGPSPTATGPNTPGPTPTSSPTTTPTGGGGASSTPTPTGTVPAGAGAPTTPPPACTPGIPVTTQIPKLLNRQYQNVVRDLLDVTALDGKPVAESLFGDFTGAMTAPAWTIYQDVAAKIAAQVMAGPNKSKFIACEPEAAGCLKTTIETFGRKAFRRALTPEEVASFESLGATTPAGTPAEVAEAILNAFLISPSFLLIPELATEAEGAAIKLSQQEVAARLSFLLWGSIPDETLSAAADANMLTTKEQILEQAKRMIAVREKTGSLIAGFHREWAQMNNGGDHWWDLDHDPMKFPTYNPAAKTTYKAELDAFFEEVAYANGSFKDLLLSNVAFVNKDNAAIYGLDPNAYTDTLTKVNLTNAEQPRPGFLTRAGFLSSYSNYDATSPILRGAFIAVWMLNVNPGAPIPGASDAKADGTFTTQRQYIEALTEKMQPCMGCHASLNPAGYVLEHYDGMGKWQTMDLRGGAIDASVTTATVDFGDGMKKEISSPTQLMEEIVKSPRAQELYARAWVSYAYGRGQNANDQCIVDTVKTKLAGDYTILTLLGDLTQADSFRLRVRGTP